MITILILAIIFLGVITYGHRKSLENLIERIDDLEERAILKEETDQE